MSKVIDYEAGLDTGEADADSIKPIKNGEDLDQTNLSRAEQNLRNRTEVLRIEANENRWARDANQRIEVVCPLGTVTWNESAGTLTFSQPGGLWILPMVNPGFSRGAVNEGGGTLYPSLYAFAEFSDGVATNFYIQSNLLDFEGGFDIEFATVDNPGAGAITVTVEGDGTVPNPATQPGARRIVVEYDSTVPHKWNEIKTAVEANATANSLVTITYAPIGVDAFDVDVELSGGIDHVWHQITTAEINEFFGGDPGNAIQEGDVLAIWYDTIQLRRESVEENGNNQAIPEASLVNLTREPEKAPNCIPIGRNLDGYFYFVNGYVLEDGVPASRLVLGPASGHVVDASSWTTLSTGNANVQETFDQIDTLLAGVGGDAGVLRGDLNRGIAAPPAPGDGAAEGAEYVGIDNDGSLWTIAPASESVQEALINLDTEFSQLQASLGPPVTGSGTERVFSLADNYEQLNTINQTLGDNLKNTLDAMYTRLKSYASLQDIFDASPVARDGLISNAERYPLFLSRDNDFAGSSSGFESLGDVNGSVQNSFGLRAISADGRYVCVPRGTISGNEDVVEIYNAKDLSLFDTVQLSSTPTEGITALASDGFSLAVAYDSKIEMFDLTAGGGPALDVAWNGTGIWTHSGTATHHITNLVFQNGWLYYGAFAADGAGDVDAGDMVGVIDFDAGFSYDWSYLAGDMVTFDVWGDKLIHLTDFGGTNLVCTDLAGNVFWENSILATWDTIFDVKINAKGVAILGKETSATDPKLLVLRLDTGLQQYEEDLGATDFVIGSLERTKENFYTMVAPAAGGDSLFAGWSLHPRLNNTSAVQDRLQKLWEFTQTTTGSRFYWRIVTDGVSLFSIRLDFGVDTSDLLRGWSLGVGSGHWMVQNRGTTSTDWSPQAIVPLTRVSPYAIG